MGLKFVKANGVSPGSGDTPLSRPDMRSIKKILGDGNCMFRALSRIVTGSQDQHSVIRAKIVQHMCDEAPLMLAHIVALPGFKECTSVQDSVHKSKMDLLGSWGTDIELLCFAHLTNTCVFTYITVQSNWERFGPHNVDRNRPVNVNAHSVYLCLKADHYELVGSTVKIPNSGHSNCPTVVDLTKESDITKPDSGSKESWPNSKPKEKIPHSEIADPAVAQAAFAASVAAERVARQVWSEYVALMSC